MRGLGIADDGFTGAGATHVVTDGPPFERPKLGGAHVTEIITQRVLAVTIAASVAEDARIAVQLDAELLFSNI